MKWVAAGLCGFELGAILTGRYPTLTALSARHRWLGPALVAALAVHLWKNPHVKADLGCHFRLEGDAL